VAKNMYYCSGFQGQTVAIFPSQDLVVVRLGLTEYPKFQLDRLLKGVSESIK
jgi:CubicO group peptidase (beta-lactamase class C family)